MYVAGSKLAQDSYGNLSRETFLFPAAANPSFRAREFSCRLNHHYGRLLPSDRHLTTRYILASRA